MFSQFSTPPSETTTLLVNIDTAVTKPKPVDINKMMFRRMLPLTCSVVFVYNADISSMSKYSLACPQVKSGVARVTL